MLLVVTAITGVIWWMSRPGGSECPFYDTTKGGKSGSNRAPARRRKSTSPKRTSSGRNSLPPAKQADDDEDEDEREETEISKKIKSRKATPKPLRKSKSKTKQKKSKSKSKSP